MPRRSFNSHCQRYQNLASLASITDITKTLGKMSNPGDFEKEIQMVVGKALSDKVDATEISIIRCHLLVEYCLNKAIKLMSKDRIELVKLNFTFSHKFKTCIAIGLFEMPHYGVEIRQFIEMLTKLRNQVAHTLEYDVDLFEKFVNSGSVRPGENEDLTKQENLVLGLRAKTAYFCGILSSNAELLFAHDTATVNDQ